MIFKMPSKSLLKRRVLEEDARPVARAGGRVPRPADGRRPGGSEHHWFSEGRKKHLGTQGATPGAT